MYIYTCTINIHMNTCTYIPEGHNGPVRAPARVQRDDEGALAREVPGLHLQCRGYC